MVEDSERSPTEGAVLACRGPTGGVEDGEGGEEAREVDGETDEVVHGTSRRRLALQPTVYRPRPRKTAPRFAARDGLGNRKRQLRPEKREPPVLLLDLRHIARRAGKADGEAVAEPKGDVVPAGQSYRSERQVRPVRKLLRDESRREILRDLPALHDADRGRSGLDFARLSYVILESERPLEAAGRSKSFIAGAGFEPATSGL